MIAKVLKNKGQIPKVIVIDEIDAFEAHEKSFLTMVKTILSSKTNTILIGIANSVDLPFRKKHSAIALRDTQILFQPYSEEQIASIIEEKVNKRFARFPLKIKEGPTRSIFFNLIDDKALDIISRKVSKMNGDVRVAFDIIKSCFTLLFNKVKYTDEMTEDSKIRITFDMVLKVFEGKYGSKIPETLRSLPR
jgi:Cdc6-like AAA superfamily ATPase